MRFALLLLLASCGGDSTPQCEAEPGVSAEMCERTPEAIAVVRQAFFDYGYTLPWRPGVVWHKGRCVEMWGDRCIYGMQRPECRIHVAADWGFTWGSVFSHELMHCVVSDRAHDDVGSQYVAQVIARERLIELGF